MWTYEEIGTKYGLKDDRLKLFIDYMKTRWADQEGFDYCLDYTEEWANRFSDHREFQASDGYGKRILLSLNIQNTDNRVCNQCGTLAKNIVYNDISWDAHDSNCFGKYI